MATVAVSRRAVARTIAAKLVAEPEKRGEWLAMGAAYLLQRGQADRVEQLVQDIARELLAQHGQLAASVCTAHQLNDDLRSQLKAFLQDKTGATSVDLSETVEPELLSGFVVTTPDYELNTTARAKLRQLNTLET
jgi:F0F1-type ATP synthase delta subunit